MRIPRPATVAAVILLTAALTPAPAGAAGPPSCSGAAGYLGTVPSPESFLGFPLGIGQQRVVTNAEIRGYLAAVDKASDRVVSGTMGTSVLGQPLDYAIVSSSRHVSRRSLDRIAGQIRELRDPRKLKAEQARRIAAGEPAIVWIAGNVHGGETSGADASLKTLYELAAGTSCAVRQRDDNLITVILPTQNPDGRDANRRQNEYGFDLNRDWFARTQPETDSKLELLRKYPPQVFVDAHEMGGQRYFFPPDADPIHHEIADAPVDWINRIGAANKAAFGYNGACSDTVTTECYFNYDTYDLFYMGYGDTVPATGFGAAGMTYEKGSASSVQDRVQQQYNTQWATLGWAAANRREVLTGYYRTWSDAVAEGRAGKLEPNQVVQPENQVRFPVPDIRVRSYFLMPGRQLADVRRLVDRLRRMDVEVYEVRKAVTIAHARIFGGRTADEVVVPKGAYWIPMDQPQKHWIQATLGEDPYVPFPYFYDVSSWSNPLLMGIDTVYTGDDVRPRGSLVTGVEGGASGRGRVYTYPLDSASAAQLTFRLLGRGIAAVRDGNLVRVPASAVTPTVDRLARSLGVTLTPSARTGGTALTTPDVGLFRGAGVSTTSGSYGEARYLLGSRWGLNLTPVTSADINDNTPAFTRRSVLLVPDGSNPTGGLTAAGQANLRAWIGAGHTYVGLRNEGTRLARAAGLTSTTEKPQPDDYLVIGSHLRVDVNPASPVGTGRPAADFAFNNGDPILTPSTTGVNVLTYPSDGTFWHNGYTVHEDVLKGTSVVVDEPTGAGRAVLFANDPLFRGYTESGMQLVANALLYPAGNPKPAARTARPEPARAAAAARPAAPNLGGEWRPDRIQVAVADLARTRSVVSRYTSTATVAVAGDSAYLTIPNPDGLQFDEHPYLRDLIADLRAAGIPLRSIVA
ncbi:carboxypeptidase [Actinoplanes sp. SE50]|uniref:M14 family zinc carboxypeptidase n=1 Tax=unclassified Actinoplanes TaxID=2626549 RepID=UPI00023EC2F1|nr:MULTISPECIES: M14 family zinc carboxypeptidase [unclassified Actinoplanes]AEV85817.1 Carboxypeptidase A1 [Actinoplanes sp. SE50/110]ATO84211.1 carboxypeptidase [Actinoplanes sp. SE50]SLM01621.1 carboxypeptidase [Actinoplanes sp. SE50/110]